MRLKFGRLAAFIGSHPLCYSITTGGGKCAAMERRDAAASHDAGPSAVPPKHKYTVGQDPARIDEILAQNRRLATSFMLSKCEREAARNWDVFYKNHEDRFFKNKNWTDREFAAELGKGKEDESAASLNEPMIGGEMTKGSNTVLLEVGCGPGNMVYPVLARNRDTKTHCCDFAERAIEILKVNPSYDENRINAFVFDLVKDGPALAGRLSSHPFGQPNVASLIFVLSAIPPRHHRRVLAHIMACLPIGGTLLFRDFGHGDLAQLRFHQKASAAWCEPALLSEEHDFYRRGDNTFTYFFNVEEMEQHAAALGFVGTVEVKEVHGMNRKTGVQLHRRFIQARWCKVF